MNKTIRVAAAIIERDGQFLLSKRLDHLHQGGKWEFPGGKIEAGETVEQALTRELQEELNITATSQSQFEQLTFDYPEKTVELHFQWVSEFKGEAEGVEGQEVKWFSKTELLQLPFPDANVPVLEKLKSIE
ncbi:8-oxo-dGTP diphosphatase MutT [Psychrosphaera ytuae]|uniref:8-oxo-dGTP diphosphatase n=1 Tax=Psychrosphaera ytuae TaxID=2820710 RepID=A0A975DAK3_9GAMM|nr:8-oxo-dGTP diphosphatase MutT [Psychrosphaera ytuae]QTH63602.1 8-oxo-dGTP diphosphatase MutT [Psychrosphaera ytuae]